MKPMHLVIACLTLAALTVGCKPPAQPTATETRDTTAQRYDPVNQAETATPASGDFPYAQRADFVAAKERELAEINRELDQLAARIEKADDAAKAEATPKLQALRDQAARLNTDLDKARDATESTWDDVKAGFRTGYAELKDGFNQARQWVGDKITP
jgi:cytochrome c556